MIRCTISLVKTVVKLVLPITLVTTALLIICVLNLRALSAVCIDRQPGDTPSFGDALVANEQYLAIGDTQANRVIVYRHTTQRQWVRFRTIPLPPNPPIADPSSNFGYSVTHKLAISGDKLVIGKVVSKMRPQPKEAALYPYKPPAEQGMAYAGAVYRTSVTSNSLLERIDQPQEKELAGFSVAADQGKIAFSVATYNGKAPGYVTVVDRDRRYSLDASGEIAMKNNLLVAGSTTDSQHGKLAVFNLAESTPSPRTISISMPVKEIDIADKFIVVAEQIQANQFPQVNPSLPMTPKTLLVNIADFSIAALDGFGKISAYGNKLVRSSPATPDGEVAGKIELFNISSIPPKSLSLRNANIRRSFLSKNYLFTVESQSSNVKICIASSSK